MSEFTPIETQEDFDKAIKSRLAQKDRELAEKYKAYLSPEDAEAMKADFKKQLEDANKSVKEAQDRLKTVDSTVSELTKRAEAAESSLLKNKVANEYKLPLERANRLIGTTEEELKKDAESLSGIIKPSNPSAPPLYTGNQNLSGNANNQVNAGYGELLAQINSQLAQ